PRAPHLNTRRDATDVEKYGEADGKERKTPPHTDPVRDLMPASDTRQTSPANPQRDASVREQHRMRPGRVAKQDAKRDGHLTAERCDDLTGDLTVALDPVGEYPRSAGHERDNEAGEDHRSTTRSVDSSAATPNRDQRRTDQRQATIPNGQRADQ